MTPGELVQRLAETAIRQKGDPILTTPARAFDLPRERDEAQRIHDRLLSYLPRLSEFCSFSKGVGLTDKPLDPFKSVENPALIDAEI